MISWQTQSSGSVNFIAITVRKIETLHDQSSFIFMNLLCGLRACKGRGRVKYSAVKRGSWGTQ